MKVIPLKIEAGITGFESPAAEYTELCLSLDELLISHPSATFIGLASGESMVGSGIYDGDLLIVDRALDAVDGDVVVVNFNGTFACKVIDTKSACLLSTSPVYAPIPIKELDTFQVEGVVCASVRGHRPLRKLLSCLRW